jgi:hypothetical protein
MHQVVTCGICRSRALASAAGSSRTELAAIEATKLALVWRLQAQHVPAAAAATANNGEQRIQAALAVQAM